MTKSNYDGIADEYYDPRHVTSRNFDDATESYFERLGCPIPDSGVVLELGAGKGRSNEFCGVDLSRIIHVDVSRRMLELEGREKARDLIQGDARRLPLRSKTIAAVTAFLYDPFNCPSLYTEIGRVLKDGGVFLGTLPHYKWGYHLRKALGYPMDSTTFVTADGDEETFESYLMDETTLRTHLDIANLSPVKFHDMTLPDSVENVSEHISIPARDVGVMVSDLPIVKVIVARRLPE